MPDDIRAALTGRGSSSPFNSRPRPSLQSSPDYGSPQYGVRASLSNRSVFVGNLPAGATIEMVKERLGAYGEIRLAEVVEKPSSNGTFADFIRIIITIANNKAVSGVNTFAFVEFRTPEAAALATNSGTVMNGCRLRIEPKVDTFRRDQVVSGSPIRLPVFDQQDAMARLFQHGVSVGLATAASQAQTVQPPVYGAYSYYHPTQYGSFANQQAQHAVVENDAPIPLPTHTGGYANQESGQYPHIQPSSNAAYPQYTTYPLRAPYEWIDPNQHVGGHDGQ